VITPQQLALSGTEHAEQCALFCWANMYAPMEYRGELRSLFAIPNGGQRGDGTERGAMIAGSRMKAEGVKEGVSDIFLPVPRWYLIKNVDHVYHGLFIEMKKLKNSYATDEQKAFIVLMKSRGYAATVCRGWIEASQVLISYLSLKA